MKGNNIILFVFLYIVIVGVGMNTYLAVQSSRAHLGLFYLYSSMFTSYKPLSVCQLLSISIASALFLIKIKNYMRYGGAHV